MGTVGKYGVMSESVAVCHIGQPEIQHGGRLWERLPGVLDGKAGREQWTGSCREGRRSGGASVACSGQGMHEPGCLFDSPDWILIFCDISLPVALWNAVVLSICSARMYSIDAIR